MTRTLHLGLCLLLTLGLCACSKTEGSLAQRDTLGHAPCQANSDCGVYGYCAPDTNVSPDKDGKRPSYCVSDCFEHSDCVSYDPNPKNPTWLCMHGRCLPPDYDGDVAENEVADVDQETGPKTGDPCKFWASADLVAKNLPNCSTPSDPNSKWCKGLAANYHDKDCVTKGWEWTCQSDNLCHSNSTVDFGDLTCPANSNAAPYEDAACKFKSAKKAASSTVSKWVGVWAGMYTTPATTTMPSFIGNQDTVSAHNLIMRVSQVGDDLIFDTKICRIYIYPFKLDTVVDDKGGMFTPPQYYNNVMIGRNFISKMPEYKAGATFKTTPHIEARGIVLQDLNCDFDPITGFMLLDENLLPKHCTESLPDIDTYAANPTDSRLWDQDFDGNPAMTSEMHGVLDGLVYSVQRYQYWYEGSVVDDNHIKGILPTYAEQYAIDASRASLKYKSKSIPYDYASKDGPTAPHDRNYFRYMRVANDYKCEDVIKEAAEKPDSYVRFTLHLAQVPDPGTPAPAVDGDK